jgi:hypothetical protein
VPIEQRLRRRDVSDTAAIEIGSDEQPIYKLHGSVNWFTGGGSRVMVVGGSKGTSIRDSSLLNAYAEAFQQCLNSGGARLMVIGYSFGDDHINDAIEAASTDHRLQTYIVNPAGLSVFDPPPRPLIQPTNELLNSLRIVGISTRPFSEAFRSDGLTFESFQRFLRD